MSFNIPAKWSNRFVACGLPHGLRLAFAEAAPEETKAFEFHSAVLLTRADALALANLLEQIAQKMPS